VELIAKIVRGLAQGEMHPHAMRRFQSRGGEGRLHALNQIRIGRRDGTTPHEIVVAARHQRRVGNRTRETFARLLETTALGEQVAQQVLRQGIGGIERQHLPQCPFGFDVAIFGQERARRAEAAESRLPSRRRRAAETADRFVTMAHGVDQRAGAEPRLGQRRLQLGGTVVGRDGRAQITPLFQGYA
jgi:hypothetical protein